ncbi:MAG: hypothetical protein JSU91_03270 [Thermoplasmatales archaeon]|nr:MAG: hypothetical protein JSU91_03270 [Thermoplasmatales archaeon]
MKKILKNKISILIIILLLSSTVTQIKADNNYIPQDINKLTYKQEINIPIDTSLENSKFQPIDLRVDFSNPCWAKDEKDHSIRIGVDDGSELLEIESQIYDLVYDDDSHISSCSIVFIIPEKANGNEKYYVFYDSSEIEPPEYEDHLALDDTHYFFEPISGQKIDFDYFGIFEDGFIIYAVIQTGEIIGNPVSHTIAKCIPNAAFLETNTIEQLAAFDLRHGVKGEPDYTGPSAATKANKKILIDGNLMVRLRLESTSPQGDIITDNIYTYYYCPTETKRIFVNVNHDVIKTINIEDPDVLDGAYTGIITIKARSTTIEKMNVGNLLPNLNLYDESESIKEYFVPPDPESVTKELILTTEDDIDLGTRGWVSLSDPTTGKVHGLIMESNVGFVDGDDDGIQIKSYVKQNIKLPGIEGDTGSVFLGRNAYETGKSQLTVIPQDFNVNFNVLFITDEDEGYEKIDSESELFQTLIKTFPVFRENVTDGEEEKEKYSLTVSVHLAPSAPMGSLLSAALGKNIPYISAEIYKENSFKSAGSVGRLPIGSIELDFEDKSFFQILKSIIGMFDWRNISFFKKIRFPDLEPGTYVVKILKENLLFNREKQYIGYSIVELKNDEKVRIFCRPQGSIKLSIVDQFDNAIENVKFSLVRDDEIISNGFSDENGTIILKAPCYPTKPYNLRVLYQGFLIEEKKVKLGLVNRLFSKKDSFSIEQYMLNLKLRDKWGFSPAVEVNPELTSNEMIEPTRISADKINEGEYLFTGLYPAEYDLFIKYKSFVVENKVSISEDESVDLLFPAEYELNFDTMNSYGYPLSDCEISLKRNKKIERLSIDNNGNVKFSVPPGQYEIVVYSDNKDIAKQEIIVRGDKDIDILTSQESFLHNIVIYLGIILAIFSMIFLIWKRKFNTGMKLFVLALLIISLFSPWWILNGDDGNIETSTKTLLFPPKIVTISSSSELIGGDVSQVPSEVTLILTLLSILLVISFLTIFITVFTKDRFRKVNMIFSILSMVFLIVSVLIFFYAMGQITEVGVGSFMGSSDLETNLPGIAESRVLPSSWGPGIGFILAIISFVIILLIFFQKRLSRFKRYFKR